MREKQLQFVTRITFFVENETYSGILDVLEYFEVRHDQFSVTTDIIIVRGK